MSIPTPTLPLQEQHNITNDEPLAAATNAWKDTVYLVSKAEKKHFTKVEQGGGSRPVSNLSMQLQGCGSGWVLVSLPAFPLPLPKCNTNTSTKKSLFLDHKLTAIPPTKWKRLRRFHIPDEAVYYSGYPASIHQQLQVIHLQPSVWNDE